MSYNTNANISFEASDIALQARGKRTNYEIRNSIQKALSSRSMTLHELTIAVESSRITVHRHLAWLKELGIVKQRSLGYRDQEKHVWELME